MMSFIPFRPLENQTSPPRAATVAIPAIVQENQAQLVSIKLLPVATVTLGYSKTVAVGSRTVATGNTDRICTIATLATIAGPHPQNEIEEEALQERAGILMANGIPQDRADGLALALHVLQTYPKAEAALCWLMDHRNGER